MGELSARSEGARFVWHMLAGRERGLAKGGRVPRTLWCRMTTETASRAMNENGRAHAGADPEDIRPVEPDPLLGEAAIEIAGVGEDTGPRVGGRESGADLATLATPPAISDTPLKGRGLGRDFEPRARRLGHRSRAWSRPCARCMRVRGPPRGASPVSRQPGPRRGSRRRQCDVRVRLSPELPKRADAEPEVLRRERGVTHQDWKAILISAEWPFSCRYPSGGERLRGAPGEEGTDGQAWSEGARRQTLPSTPNIVSQPTRKVCRRA
ncbi:hypothetical protein BC826DRAFT_408229 [Russula brevipes]|nr:hypothetical protein BC826DRAFT_408229 [Russula brevipes]